ncbi:MAG: hypothetical protein DRO96_01565 [Candidatus Aenigmatarchaeota archaeon]|nr:MAG: hypothetical protein DRO96_01565 [Candidatus Aenigmarchaeota archaeon]
MKTIRKRITNKFRLATRLIEYHGLQRDPIVLPLFQSFAYNQENEQVFKMLMTTINNHPTVQAKRKRNIPFHTPTPEEETPESIRIGEDELKRPYYIKVSELIKVLFIAGKIGLGKTTIILNILYALCLKNIPGMKKIRWIAVDMKRDTRGIHKELSKHDPIVFLRYSLNKTNFKYNPLQKIPALSAAEQDTIFSNVLAEVGWIRQGSQHILLQHLSTLRKEKENPTIKNLITSIEKKKYKTWKENEWKASCLRALTSLLTSFPDMLSCERGINIIDLLSQTNTVFELDNAGDFRGFWATLPIAYFIKHRINSNIRGSEAPPFIITIDEGNFIFSNDIKENSIGGIPVINGLLELGREFKIGWIIASNTPSNLSTTIKANSSSKLLLYVGDWRNVKDMADSMGLSQRQAKHTLTFKPSNAIAKREGLEAHQITLDDIRTKKEIVFDKEIDAISQPILDKYPVVLQTNENNAEEKSTLNPLERELLMHIKENLIPKSEHANKLGWGRSKTNTLFNNLSDLFLKVTLPTGKKGNQPKYLILKKQAYQELEIPYDNGTRGGGEVHDWLVTYYKKQLTKSGFETTTSLKINDSKEIDLAILQPEHKIAVEITDTTTVHGEIEGATSSLKEFSHIIIIAVNKSKALRLQEELLQQPLCVQKKVRATHLVNNLIPLIEEVLA